MTPRQRRRAGTYKVNDAAEFALDFNSDDAEDGVRTGKSEVGESFADMNEQNVVGSFDVPVDDPTNAQSNNFPLTPQLGHNSQRVGRKQGLDT